MNEEKTEEKKPSKKTINIMLATLAITMIIIFAIIIMTIAAEVLADTQICEEPCNLIEENATATAEHAESLIGYRVERAIEYELPKNCVGVEGRIVGYDAYPKNYINITCYIDVVLKGE